jgi:hypothetical protein
MKRLTEAQVRQVIREELRNYLIEEGMLKNITAGVLAGLAAAGLQYLIKEPTAQAEQAVEEMEELKDTQEEEDEEVIEVDQQIFDKAEQIIVKLVTKGANEDYAREIVSRVFVGAANEFDSSHEEKEPNFEKEKIKFINNKLGEILNDETLYKILAFDFMKHAENVGRSEAVAAASHFGTSSPKLSIEFALANGFLLSARENYKEAFQNSKIKKDEQGNTYYLFDPMKLGYWDDKIQRGSELSQLVGNNLGNVKIPKKMFDAAQAIDMERYIGKQLQENKVKKLRQRINELRGVYV